MAQKENALIRNGKQFGDAGFFASNDFIGIVALAVIPVLGFFAIATLIRRAQDLRNAATAVTHAAIRLAVHGRQRGSPTESAARLRHQNSEQLV